ncbi:MAG: cyclic nucleotide-binding domain-containing protein [Rubrivivax sp.]
MPTRIELLQGAPVFGAIREDTLQFLLERARMVEVAAGGFFFREGDSAESMFVLEAGRAEVFKTWQQREFVLLNLAPGDCFGEMALLDLFPRSANVRAVTDCLAIELGTAVMYDLFHFDTEQFALVQMNIGREVCRRLRATDEMLFRASMGERGAIAGPWYRAA